MVHGITKRFIFKCVFPVIFFRKVLPQDIYRGNADNKIADEEFNTEIIQQLEAGTPFQNKSRQTSFNNSDEQDTYHQELFDEQGIDDRQKMIRKSQYASDKKQVKQSNHFDPNSLMKPLDKIPMNKLLDDPYKLSKIKESEKVEKNLKRLLKILDESGVVQSKLKDKEHEDIRSGIEYPPQFDIIQEDALIRGNQIKKQRNRLSDTKSLVKEGKKSMIPKDLSAIEEVLVKEMKKVLKDKEIISDKKHSLTPIQANSLAGKDEVKIPDSPNAIDQESRSLITFLAPLLVQLEEDPALTSNYLRNTNEFNLNYPDSIRKILYNYKSPSN